MGRDYWLFFIGRASSMFGSSFTRFAIPLLILQMTGSATDLGLALATSMLPYLLFGLIIGAIVDAANRKRLMIFADLSRAILVLTVPILDALGQLEILHLYVILFITSSLGVVYQTGEFAGIARLVPRSMLEQANSRLQATSAVAGIAGPILAGAFATLFPLSGLLIIDAATFVVSVLTLRMIRIALNADREPVDSRSILSKLRSDISEGLRFVWDRAVLRDIAMMMALVNFFGAMTLAQLPLLAIQRYDAEVGELGLLYAAGGAGIAVLSLVAGPLKARIPLERLLMGTLVLVGVATVVMGSTSWIWIAVFAWSLTMGAGALFNIYTTSLRQAIIPEKLLGRVIAVASVLAWSAIPIGAVFGGMAATRLDEVAPLYLVSGSMTVVVAVVFFSFTSLRRVGLLRGEFSNNSRSIGNDTSLPGEQKELRD